MSDDLTRPFGRLSQGLERLGDSRRAQRLVTGSPAAREVAGRFIAAERTDAALELVRSNHDKGLLATLEPLLDEAHDREQAARARDGYVALAQAVGRAGLGPVAELTVKPSRIGLSLPRDGGVVATAHLAEVCRAAANASSQVCLDLEGHTTTDATFALFSELHQDFPQLGVTVQAQLRRSLADSRWLAGQPARVRLCKGGWSVPREISHDGREAVDGSFRECLDVLMAGRCYPMVATHDPELVLAADELAARHGRAMDGYEFQMYHGVRPWEHRRLVDTGHRVRVHLPVGRDWYGYLVHRVAERPANVLPLLRALVTRR